MLDLSPPHPPPTADADGSEANDVPFGSLQESVALRDWLLSEGARLPQADDLLAGMSERLIALCVP
ncbi:MAG: adenylate/guanylate cyclase domain-containing protein, partial [Zymomonas sp.]